MPRLSRGKCDEGARSSLRPPVDRSLSGMDLVWPSRPYLSSYVDALNRGWSPDNVRGDFARLEELRKMAADSEGFLAALVDREAKAGPITMPDGPPVPRLPGYRR